tara:strand:- start:108 stop:341 length:234 start_codon:yes stop_codon:yes gene_type:complete
MKMCDYTHCPGCGRPLADIGWCRQCGDIGDLDEYKDDQLDRAPFNPMPPIGPFVDMQKDVDAFMDLSIFRPINGEKK